METLSRPGSRAKWRPELSIEQGRLIVWTLALIFLGIFGVSMLLEFWRFSVHAFDFAIFDQGLWLLSEGEEPFVTVRGLHLFGDHSSYIMLLLAPVYVVLPYPEVLLVFTVAVIAVGGPLVYSLGRELGASQALSTVAASVYLLHPATSWNAFDNFHPEVLTIPLVIGGFLLIQRDRAWWGLALLGVALLAKEDVALLLIPLGLYLAVATARRWVGFALAGASLVALVANLWFLLPHFSPSGELLYADRYAPFGEGLIGLAFGLVTSPGLLLETVLEPSKLGYLAAMFLPVAPLALLAPRMLLVSVPPIMANVLSTFPYQTEIRWHYTTYTLIVLGLAVAIGAAKLTEKSDDIRKLAIGSLGLAVAFHVALAPNPIFQPEHWDSAHPDHEVMSEAASLIPNGAVVAASDTFVAHLAHRRGIYLFPNPWLDHNYGTPEDQPPSPDVVEWVIVRADAGEPDRSLIDELRESGDFRVAFDRAPALVLTRSP
jgi:uncharacterized membrane protein